jgi:hypothetical protein
VYEPRNIMKPNDRPRGMSFKKDQQGDIFMMTRLNTDLRIDGSGPVVCSPTTQQVLAQFEQQNHLCSFCAKPLDPSGEGVAVNYDGIPLHMHTLVHLNCKAEIEAAKDRAWLDSPAANADRERLIRRGFSPGMVEHLMKKIISHGIELWTDQDGNCMEIVDGELIDMHIAAAEHPE